MLFIETCLQKYDPKNDRYNADLRGTFHFQFCSWVFTLGCIEDKRLVNCGGFLGDKSIIHDMKSNFRCSE